MKVRLYKGPLHGKVVMVRDGEGQIILNTWDKKANRIRWDLAPTAPFAQTINYKQVVYRAVPMKDFRGNFCYATHPDGSTIFQYVA